jgi:chemotaxis protein methyltransferase CheR
MTPVVDPAEVAPFSQWLYDEFGYDFRNYQTTPLCRSLETILERRSLGNVDGLKALLLADRTLFPSVLAQLTVTTSSMFRNPPVFAALLREVFPYLRTYSSLKIWHAGCARGEEAYSLAVLLKEQGLLERSRIYATDINPEALAAARAGIYPMRRFKEFARNYVAAGGAGHLSDHFELKYGHAKINSELGERILFSKHDLVADAPFGEMQLILCRNVMIYFNPSLQQRTLELFRSSLSVGGFLCLGNAETTAADAAKAGLSAFVRAEMILRAA